MDLGLKGCKALVTGASKGLGYGCAQALSREGASVFIVSRDEERLKKAADSAGAAGHLAADVSRAEDCERVVKAASDKLGGLDILVANAGGPPPGTFTTTAIDEWEKGWNLTLMSVIRLVNHALPHLRKSGQGRVVYLGSTSVREPIAVIVQSNAYRSAVVAALKTLAGEVAKDGITVNHMATGNVMTDRIVQIDEAVAKQTGKAREQVTQDRLKNIPMGRLGTIEEYGAICAFLCSKQAAYNTGQTSAVDGGMLRGVY
jgi:3-oxoacyl-[acyl-carrier protein] reductase